MPSVIEVACSQRIENSDEKLASSHYMVRLAIDGEPGADDMLSAQLTGDLPSSCKIMPLDAEHHI